MALANHILDALKKAERVEASMQSPGENTIAWVAINKIFPSSDPDTPKFGQSIKPNATYMIRWVEMSKSHYEAYLRGSDVGINSEASKLDVELADDDAELERILVTRLDNLDKLVPRSKNPVRYP